MASGSGGVLVVTVLGIGLAATVQFGCALLGAWIAEKFTDN
jgi:hypothetical protein